MQWSVILNVYFFSDIKYIDETTDDESKEGDKLLGGNETEDDNEDVKTPNQNGDISVSGTPAVTTNETSPMLSEIQLEIENNTEPPKETDALVESWKLDRRLFCFFISRNGH